MLGLATITRVSDAREMDDANRTRVGSGKDVVDDGRAPGDSGRREGASQNLHTGTGCRNWHQIRLNYGEQAKVPGWIREPVRSQAESM